MTKLLLKPLLKIWFPNALNIIVFAITFSFLSLFCIAMLNLVYHDTHDKGQPVRSNNALHPTPVLPASHLQPAHRRR